MKKLVVGVSLIVALIVVQTASADSRHYRSSYDRHGYSGHYYSRANPYHFGYGGRSSSHSYSPRRYYGGSYFGFSSGSYFGHHRHNDFGYLLGGIVLGSLLSYPSYREPVTPTRKIIYAKVSRQRGALLNTGRRLLRDLEGNCFERITDEDGNEIRVQLEASECSF